MTEILESLYHVKQQSLAHQLNINVVGSTIQQRLFMYIYV